MSNQSSPAFNPQSPDDPASSRESPEYFPISPDVSGSGQQSPAYNPQSPVVPASVGESPEYFPTSPTVSPGPSNRTPNAVRRIPLVRSPDTDEEDAEASRRQNLSNLFADDSDTDSSVLSNEDASARLPDTRGEALSLRNLRDELFGSDSEDEAPRNMNRAPFGYILPSGSERQSIRVDGGGRKVETKGMPKLEEGLEELLLESDKQAASDSMYQDYVKLLNDRAGFASWRKWARKYEKELSGIFVPVTESSSNIDIKRAADIFAEEYRKKKAEYEKELEFDGITGIESPEKISFEERPPLTDAQRQEQQARAQVGDKFYKIGTNAKLVAMKPFKVYQGPEAEADEETDLRKRLIINKISQAISNLDDDIAEYFYSRPVTQEVIYDDLRRENIITSDSLDVEDFNPQSGRYFDKRAFMRKFNTWKESERTGIVNEFMQNSRTIL